MVDSGKVESWKVIAPILNQQLRNDETEYRDESAYRKKYQYAKMFYEDVFSKMETDDYIKELEEQKKEIQKERVKLRDERALKNRDTRIEARVEQKLDYLEKVISQQGKIDYQPLKKSQEQDSGNDLIIMLSDLHIGQNFVSAWGRYNLVTAKDRIEQYLSKIIEIKKRHNSSNCFVTLEI